MATERDVGTKSNAEGPAPLLPCDYANTPGNEVGNLDYSSMVRGRETDEVVLPLPANPWNDESLEQGRISVTHLMQTASKLQPSPSSTPAAGSKTWTADAAAQGASSSDSKKLASAVASSSSSGPGPGGVPGSRGRNAMSREEKLAEINKERKWGASYSPVYPTHPQVRSEVQKLYQFNDDIRCTSQMGPSSEAIAKAASHQEKVDAEMKAAKAKLTNQRKEERRKQQLMKSGSLSDFSVLESESSTLPLGKPGEDYGLTHDPHGAIGGVHGPMLSYMTWAHQEDGAETGDGVPLPPKAATYPIPVPAPPTVSQAGGARARSLASTSFPESSGSAPPRVRAPRYKYTGGMGKPRQDPAKIYTEKGGFRLKGVQSMSDVQKYTQGIPAFSRKSWDVREAYKLMRAEQHATAVSQTWAALHQWTSSDRPFDQWYDKKKRLANKP